MPPPEYLARRRSLFEGEWREALHVDGSVYFYNTATREAQLTPPADLYPKRRMALRNYMENMKQLKE